MNKPWSYTSNVFLNATKGMYSLAMRISAYHDAALYNKLGTNIIIDEMYARYHPTHVAFETCYSGGMSQQGIQKAKTVTLKQLLKMLSAVKIDAFEAEIKIVYAKNSERFMALFPDGREPFQKGKQVNRIAAVGSLLETIGNDVALADAKNNIQAFYSLLTTANNAQKESKGSTRYKRNELEKARIEMCNMQFANLGGLMQLFYENPKKCDLFFDLEAIRNHQQVLYKGTLAAHEQHLILVHTFYAGDCFTIITNQPAQLCLSSNEKLPLGNTIDVEANKLQTINLTDFEADLTTHRYLFINNKNNEAVATFKLKLI